MRTLDEIYADIQRQHVKLGTYRRDNPLPYSEKYDKIFDRLTSLEAEYHDAKQVVWDEVCSDDEVVQISENQVCGVYCDGEYHFFVREDDICLGILECNC